MNNLRDPYVNSAAITVGTGVRVPIRLMDNTVIWCVEQINVFYNRQTEQPQVSVSIDGVNYSGPAPMIPGLTGLGQTFSGLPFIYMQNRNLVEVVITNGAIGAMVTIQVQRRELDAKDPELAGRF